MSRTKELKYTCPYCGREFDITVYESVNSEQDPDLRDACLSGDLFRHSCPHCHTDFMVQYPLVYSDPKNKFVIWLSANTGEESIMKAAAGPLLKQGYKLRRCATIREFTEKIQIFEDGVSDIAVELAKYDSFIEFIDNRRGNPADVTSVEYQRVNDGVMKINVRTDDKGLSFLIPMDLLEEEIRAESDRFAVNEEEFPLINSDWIISLFMESSGQA
ncbi:MAG: CpXC domain-containing protein [Solobacterium sp.]|nr:CpXC domain-containing protein [Solobacterium sp.]